MTYDTPVSLFFICMTVLIVLQTISVVLTAGIFDEIKKGPARR